MHTDTRTNAYGQTTHSNTHTHTHMQTPIFAAKHTYTHAHTNVCVYRRAMGWLRLVESITLFVSFAENILFCRALLQKRPLI